MSLDWLSHPHNLLASPIHRLPAALKLGVALGLIVVTVLMPASQINWFIAVAAFLVFVAWVSRIPPGFLIKRLLLLSPLVLGVALVNALQPASPSDWRVVAARGLLCLLTVTLVSNTTPFGQILRVLRHVRVPGLLITTIALMHRYLFVLAEEAERMRRARASRTFNPTPRFQWHVLATVLGQLFVRASERAERIYDAMCARGWK